MKLLLLGNQARAMANFWSVLIRRAVAAGHEVVCAVPHALPSDDPVWEAKLSSLGVRLAHYPLDRKGLNPLRDLRTVLALRALFKAENPDRLFAYTIKPVTYGAVAAALAGTPERRRRTLMITGLGYAFEADSLPKRILRRVTSLLYRTAFSLSGTVYFQNMDDRKLFDAFSIIPDSITARMCRGTGVDTVHFAPAPLPELPDTPTPEHPAIFLFVGRLLEAKGLRELCQAARLIKERGVPAVVRLLGPAESGLGSMPLEEILALRDEGVIEYLGETADVRPFIAGAHALVLPSWREGTPCSLMEGMSMGRAVVAADAPGSREVVRPGENGLMVPLRDAEALADALAQLAHDPQRLRAMGAAGRALALAEFDAETVAAGILTDMNLEQPD